MQKFLVIQTAFIGDVVLATGLVEKLHQHFPDAQIDFLLRKGNEGLLKDHPFIHEVLIWNKKENKWKNLLRMRREIRRRQYDKVINIQRFASTGWLTAFSGGKETIGFDKNPFSRLFNKRIKHHIGEKGVVQHETERNHDLIRHFTDDTPARPRLYPAGGDRQAAASYKKGRYLTISPSSVWFTKQYPLKKWVSFINKVSAQYTIYLLGGPGDAKRAERIRVSVERPAVFNLCGKLNFLQSAALMEDAAMNYVNDSAPLHFASATNAPVTAVYCSTVPAFGYGPLSDKSFVVEVEETLPCRPCGLHGRKACPEGHFNCAQHIKDEQLIASLLAE